MLYSLSFDRVLGDSRVQELAQSNREQLDQLLQHAQEIGVPLPVSSLSSDKNISCLRPMHLFSLLDIRPVDTYYQAQVTHMRVA